MATKAQLDEFVAEVARLTQDGECPNCHGDGYDDNDDCDGHYPFDMPNDDAVTTLHDLIRLARGLAGEEEV